MIKRIGGLLVALIKLGFIHVVNFFDFIITKYYIKQPRKTQSKIQDDEYISTKEYDLSEEEETRWRQEFMLKKYDYQLSKWPIVVSSFRQGAINTTRETPHQWGFSFYISEFKLNSLFIIETGFNTFHMRSWGI